MTKLNKILFPSFLAVLSTQIFAVDSYDVIDLGKLDDKSVFAQGINNADSIVGYGYTAFSDGDLPYHGFVYQNGLMTDLGAIENETTDISIAYDISDNDLVVGLSSETIESTDVARGFYKNVSSSEFNLIPSLDENSTLELRALAVNNNDYIVGFGRVNPSDDVDVNGNSVSAAVARGFVFDTVNQVLTQVDPLNYTNVKLESGLRDINNMGRAIGWSHVYVDNLLYAKSIYVDVSAPDTAIKLSLSDEKRSDFPFAINDNNLIVGKRHVGDSFYFSAFIYDMNTQTITDIPDLTADYKPSESADISIAYSINNQNQVVGTSLFDVVRDRYHAILFEGGVIKDLNNLIDCKSDPDAALTGSPDWVLYEARAINDNGIIIGNGFYKNERRAFMLKPRADGVQPKLCISEPTEEDDSGSGSLPVSILFVLMGLSLVRRLKKN